MGLIAFLVHEVGCMSLLLRLIQYGNCFLIRLFKQTNDAIKLYDTVARAEGGRGDFRGAFLVFVKWFVSHCFGFNTVWH